MEKLTASLVKLVAGKRSRRLSATRIVAAAFLGIILLGATLLTLPVSSRDGISCGFFSALFTATSATCVTGLVLFDTFTQWSGFGQGVIICLIQIGGLGFMSVATLVIFMMRRKLGLKQRLVMAQALSVNDMGDVVRLQKWVLVGSLTVEALGALILTVHFLPEFGWATALKWAVFHSISAFCNAGFDIFGSLSPGGSLAPFQSDPVVLLTLSALIVTGGLGFLVWQELAQVFRGRKLSVYAKLVLLMTGALLLLGTVGVALAEWDNQATLGGMSTGDKLLNSFFQSATARTAGFAALDQACLTDTGKAVTMVLMIIGGSSGSTAGGIKTVTMLVLLLFFWSRARGRRNVCVFRRTIPPQQVMDAMTIAGMMVGLAVFGGIFISATSPVGFTDGLFESISALATVGLTAGATTKLSVAAQMLMIVYMYFGRVGILTISLGFLMGDKIQERYEYARTDLLIG